MVAHILELLRISGMTVSKVLFCSVIGALISRRYLTPSSVKGFSHILINLFIPCLLFTRLVEGLSLDTIHLYVAATMVAYIQLFVGFLASVLLSGCVSPDEVGMTRLGCVFSNAVPFALSIITSLHEVSWLDRQALHDAQIYIFVYNIANSTTLWSVGRTFVKRAAAKSEALASASAGVTSDCVSAGILGRARSLSNDFLGIVCQQPLLSTCCGLFVALTPLRNLALSEAASPLFGGMGVLGGGTVPLVLFLLGAQLSSTRSDGPRPVRPTVVVCTVRFLLAPLVMTGVLEILLWLEAVPTSRVFHFVMIVQAIAPPAINTSVICSLYNYKAAEYIQVIFVTYVVSAISSAGWLAFALWRVSDG